MRAGTDASDAPAAAGPAWTAPSHPPCGKLPAASRPTTDSSLLAQKGVFKKKQYNHHDDHLYSAAARRPYG